MKYMQKITTEIISEHIDRYIECGYRISVKEMADRSGYSLRHLQRMFIQETGIPLGEYIRRRRLSRSAAQIIPSLIQGYSIKCRV